jgi:hypothetical protein
MVYLLDRSDFELERDFCAAQGKKVGGGGTVVLV